ncbi:MAG: type I methionyl aminopeptidase [Chloroflexota bacterium]
MTIESPGDVQGLLAAGRVVGLALRELEPHVRPGVTTAQLNELAERFLRRHGARSAPLLTYGFPGAVCVSINDEAAHGVPGERTVRAGDLVKLDISAELGGYFADAAVTVAVPPVSRRHQQLRDCARAALAAAMSAVRAGAPISAVGRAAEAVARRAGFRIVRELHAHGIGRALHEEPHDIPQFFAPGASQRLHAGLVFTIEPHVAAGSGRIFAEPDGWTLTTLDGGYVAQFEHTVIVTERRPIVVTAVAP